MASANRTPQYTFSGLVYQSHIVEGKSIAMLNGQGNPFGSIKKEAIAVLLFKPSSALYIYHVQRAGLENTMADDVHMPNEGGGASTFEFR